MATIKPIEGRSVHQIQSGQVIVDLCSVVKELVENSLDAGATSIDVRFKNQGLESIEVQDNGDGISQHNYETVALKHHTSKLSTYSDLTTLQTFGFRGEALSSLCALSRFSIVTCMAKDAPKGTKLDFEVSGKLKGTNIVAAQKGTTVTVENLFNNLPVRRRELERNIKREWGRVVGVLGQYACIQTGIKFSVTQHAGKGKKTTIFSTKGNQFTKENIVNIFGAKTLTALVPLDLNLELEPTSGPSQRGSTQDDGGKKNIRITGHISRPASGEGRQTPDRQMFFVNSRPCGLPQVAKAFNEVYKAYNASQSPFIFANIELNTHLYDVNVSPDKRTILLHDQTRMLENLKTALTELFESQDYTVPIAQLPMQKQPSYKQLTISRETSAIARNAQTPTQSAGPDESEEDSPASRREQSVGNERQKNPNSTKLGRGVVSIESVTHDREPIDLDSNWLGRQAEDRPDQPPKTADEKPVGLSKDKRSLIGKLGRESERLMALYGPPDDPDSSFPTSDASSALLSHIPVTPVAESNQKAAEIQHPTDNIGEQPKQHDPPIPAIVSPSKLASAVSGTFSGSSRLQRAPAEIATITIGDHTVTSSTGTPRPKRARVEIIETPSRNKRTSKAAPQPSFGTSLSQRFAAPGTTQQAVDSEPGTDEEVLVSFRSNDIPESPNSSEEDVENQNRCLEPLSSETFVLEGNVDSSISNADVDEDVDYVDDASKKALEEAIVQEMIQIAEDSAAQPSQENANRTKILLRGGTKQKDSTVNLIRSLNIHTSGIRQQLRALNERLDICTKSSVLNEKEEALDSDKAEDKLSLTISKSDFTRMKIVGQFNLGFILASRTSGSQSADGQLTADDLFIIDQHASDEKYNFERLQATTIVQSQRLVYPKTLDLTALEEEIVIENLHVLETNGFVVTVDESGEAPVGQRCQLVSLPLSRETAFSISDLEELIALLSEHPPGSIPRPSKVRKMFAMRACRSSIMIGRTLTNKQMAKVVTHLGELDKPWNCPHGRPTMRHLCGLGIWDELGWKDYNEPGGETAEITNWGAYIRQRRANFKPDSPCSP